MGIINMYMIRGFGFDLRELLGDIGFLGMDTWVIGFFWAE